MIMVRLEIFNYYSINYFWTHWHPPCWKYFCNTSILFYLQKITQPQKELSIVLHDLRETTPMIQYANCGEMWITYMYSDCTNCNCIGTNESELTISRWSPDSRHERSRLTGIEFPQYQLARTREGKTGENIQPCSWFLVQHPHWCL